MQNNPLRSFIQGEKIGVGARINPNCLTYHTNTKTNSSQQIKQLRLRLNPATPTAVLSLAHPLILYSFYCLNPFRKTICT
jgi:hypothetical protein